MTRQSPGLERVPGNPPADLGADLHRLPFAAGTTWGMVVCRRTIRGMRMTLAVNTLGLPAVAVPVGIEEVCRRWSR